MFIAYYVYDKIPVFTAKPAKSLAKYNESKFLSGHFIFTDGAFCLDILYDEDYYFLGEEYNLSSRAFTHGYEFFTTGKIICWHEYIRKNKPKHRSDHRPDFIQQRRYDAYLKHMEMFIHRRNVPIKYFGNEKKLRDYEKWIGLDERRTVP
jgi:GT2 family glycosyltransferase